MKQTLALSLLLALTTACSAQFPRSLKEAADKATGKSEGGLSNADVIAGLKEALNKGTEQSVSVASVVDGFNANERIRIPFPPEAEKMKNTLRTIGMEKQVQEFEITLNRAAEKAVKEAVPIFMNAIRNMTVADGFAILRGADNAATEYLRENTSGTLTSTFHPIVEKATQEVALTSYWTPLANGYNKATMLTGGKAVDPDLDAYVTQKAIDGLFVLIADEEGKIRKDPVARTTDLLRRVFGQP